MNPLEPEPDRLTSSNPQHSPSSTPQRMRVTPASIVLGVTLGVLVTLIAGLFSSVWLLRDPMPRVTPKSLQAAMTRWEEHGPRSYNLDVRLSGNQQGEIHIEVLNGEVVAMTRDGVTPTQRRTWDYWSVPNQLEMIAQDLSSADDPQQAFGVASPSQVVMKADFDPRFGYPRVYQRVILGTGAELRWEITSFEVVDKS